MSKTNLVLGSIVAVPVFFIAWAVLLVAAYQVLWIINDYSFDAPLMLKAFMTSAGAGCLAVYGAWVLLRATVKAWSWWPILVAYIIGLAYVVWAAFNYPPPEADQALYLTSMVMPAASLVTIVSLMVAFGAASIPSNSGSPDEGQRPQQQR